MESSTNSVFFVFQQCNTWIALRPCNSGVTLTVQCGTKLRIDPCREIYSDVYVRSGRGDLLDQVLHTNACIMMTSSNGDISALLAICAGNSPVNGEFPSQSQRRGALMFSLSCAWINAWVNNRANGDLRRHRAHYDGTVMWITHISIAS